MFAISINAQIGFKSGYDLSRLYTQGFFEEKIEKLNLDQCEKLKEICDKILYFLNQIQYNYFDENENINGTQQKDIDLFNHVIKILEEKDKREMNTPLNILLSQMKEVNSRIKGNIP